MPIANSSQLVFFCWPLAISQTGRRHGTLPNLVFPKVPHDFASFKFEPDSQANAQANAKVFKWPTLSPTPKYLQMLTSQLYLESPPLQRTPAWWHDLGH